LGVEGGDWWEVRGKEGVRGMGGEGDWADRTDDLT